jgi:hypothetical protein
LSASDDWALALMPTDEGWRGSVAFADGRRAAVEIQISDEDAESARFELAPLEFLIANTTPSGRSHRLRGA